MRCPECNSVINYRMEGKCPICYWAEEILKKSDARNGCK